MAYPTPVNSQITDATTQTGVSVLAQAPGFATAAMYQTASHSIGVLYQNAVQTQRNNAISSQASANQGVVQIYTTPTMAGAMAAVNIARSHQADNTVAILTALKELLNEKKA